MNTNYYKENKERLLQKAKDRYQKNKESICLRRRENMAQETQEERIKRLAFHRKYNIEYKERNYELSQTDEYKFKQYKFASKRRSYEFKLAKDAFIKLFHSNCSYCGQEDSRGIDRIDNKIGYTNENSVPCCEICNKMKWKLNVEDFLSHVKKIGLFTKL